VSPRALSECTLLLVDDEPANLELLEVFLAQEGLGRLVSTSDAREALPLFDANAPDLVLLDLNMPHVSGFEVMQGIRARTTAADFIPILVLTADASRAVRARALSEGANDFLTKPLDAVEVRLRVRNLLNTRLLHLEQRRALEAAEAATAARDRVLSVVAHDLRNPLAAISMDAEMVRYMLSEEEHPAQHQGVGRIERTAQRMHGMIEDLLDVSRLERGTFAVRPVPAAPRDILAEAEAMLQPLARAQNVRLDFEGPGDLPSIPMDGARVLQVLSNLVGNALKFTREGGSVRVTWSVDAAALTLRVADTGVGIPPSQLPRVFGEFWQGTSAHRRSGIGLGLVIARAIVEAHGGKIDIQSTVGVGTTVTFWLPLAGAGSAVAPPAQGGWAQTSAEPARA
jgi:signal transduction histidine kinase